MTAENVCFSADYAEAREKFLGAARIAGATHKAYANPLKGPKGDSLATDVAYIGDRQAPKVLTLFSATHGVEGFCGLSGGECHVTTTTHAMVEPSDGYPLLRQPELLVHLD